MTITMYLPSCHYFSFAVYIETSPVLHVKKLKNNYRSALVLCGTDNAVEVPDVVPELASFSTEFLRLDRPAQT